MYFGGVMGVGHVKSVNWRGRRVRVMCGGGVISSVIWRGGGW